MKKIVCLILTLVLALSFSSCSNQDEKAGNQTTTQPQGTADSTKTTTTAALSTTAATTAATTLPLTADDLVEKEIFLDPMFKTGFKVHGPQHNQGWMGEIYPTDIKGVNPDWMITQWACKYNLLDGEFSFDEKGYEMKTESQYLKVEYTDESARVHVQIDASKEFDAPRKPNESWPHILVEQREMQGRVGDLGALYELVFSINSRVPVFEDIMGDEADETMHAAQAGLYFTIREKTTQDMYWFGIPFYDNRWDFVGPYYAIDGGKDDATGKVIYKVAQTEFTDKTLHGGEWVRYEKNILPYIEAGLIRAKNDGYLDSYDLNNYTIDSMNIGLEMFGTYDLAFEFEDLSLVAKTVK